MADDDPEHDDTGQFKAKYEDEAFLDALEDESGMAGTQDVADRVGCSYELAYKRLRAFKDGGVIESRKVGNARLWILSDDSDRDE